jgi:hypothetical protein
MNSYFICQRKKLHYIVYFADLLNKYSRETGDLAGCLAAEKPFAEGMLRILPEVCYAQVSETI